MPTSLASPIEADSQPARGRDGQLRGDDQGCPDVAKRERGDHPPLPIQLLGRSLIVAESNRRSRPFLARNLKAQQQ